MICGSRRGVSGGWGRTLRKRRELRRKYVPFCCFVSYPFVFTFDVVRRCVAPFPFVRRLVDAACVLPLSFLIYEESPIVIARFGMCGRPPESRLPFHSRAASSLWLGCSTHRMTSLSPPLWKSRRQGHPCLHPVPTVFRLLLSLLYFSILTLFALVALAVERFASVFAATLPLHFPLAHLRRPLRLALLAPRS